MKRNPINIFNDIVDKAKAMFECSYILTIHSKRAQKLSKIDLRKYRGNPDKKNQIRKLIILEAAKAARLRFQLMIISSQPIIMQAFESGAIISEKGQKPCLSDGCINNTKGLFIENDPNLFEDCSDPELWK